VECQVKGRKCQSLKNVSANLQRTVILPESVQMQLSMTACARSAMKRGGQQKQILTGTRTQQRSVRDIHFGDPFATMELGIVGKLTVGSPAMTTANTLTA
jgi:hypothetical protein